MGWWKVEGTQLQQVDGIVALDHDEYGDDERAELHRELDASIAEADAGLTEDFGSVIRELRQSL